MANRRFWLMVPATGLLGLFGCCSDCDRVASGPTFTPSACVPRAVAPGSPLPPRFTPQPQPPVVSTTPPAYLPPAAAPAPSPPPTSGPSVQGTYSIPIPPEPAWKPSTDPGVRLAPPEPDRTEKPQESARLPVPQTKEPQESARLPVPQTKEPPPAAAVPSPPMMPKASDTEGTPPLPVDIPQFAAAKTRVAAGQKPLPDGVSWLQANGYRTVLHIHKPGEDEVATRRQFEKKGLKYISLELTPETLTKSIVDRFNQIVGDESNLPLFVYDHDGSLAGGLWYLHFRQIDKAADEKARAEAGRLGFKEEREGEHRTMWIAVQNYLKNNN